MKLRFRNNSLRLRVNQREVDGLADGLTLRERVHFPGNSQMGYVLEPVNSNAPLASFQAGIIHIAAPQTEVTRWAKSEEIGLYFELPANGSSLKVAIEKDLECTDGPVEERDPEAFPRSAGTLC